ncbi:MAG: hypothetical protein HQK60_15265 [Deltaproteobacteria bacterium]|nr:hypothetical protein [Deltaproteobacteria bacterium]
MWNFDLMDTVAGRQIYWAGIRKGRREVRREIIREGRIKQARENILDILTARFEFVPQDILYKIDQIERHDTLKKLVKTAIKTADLWAFRSKLP